MGKKGDSGADEISEEGGAIISADERE